MKQEDHWKIARDNFYFTLFQRYGLAHIQELGFFFDSQTENIQLLDSVDLLCTPLSFPSDQSPGEKSCVLLSTGAFCPPHRGHLDIMEKAKQALSHQGWTVLTGYLSPGHDEYINSKCTQAAIPIAHRIKLLQEQLAGIDWLRIDPWEGVFNRVAVNFTDVITRLQAYIARHSGENIPVFYICGSDNARFAATFAEQGYCVVVKRPGFEREFFRYQVLQNDRILFVDGENPLSSSALRAERKFTAAGKKPLHLRSNHDPREAQLLEILQPYFSSITLCHNATQSESLQSEHPIISLDANLRSHFNLNISREFDTFAISGLSYKARTGYPPLPQQCAAIPANNYILFDGDIHTGGTMAFAKALLQEHGCKIVHSKTFINAQEGLLKDDEILDTSDFFIEGGSGLSIRLTSDTKLSAPYLFPYVDPFIRCSISQPMDFSIAVWKMNMDLLAEKSTTLADSQHSRLFEYIGFKRSDSLYQVCKWHHDLLKKFQ